MGSSCNSWEDSFLVAYCLPIVAENKAFTLIITRLSRPATNALIGLLAYRLKYVHAASANKTIVAIQRDESLIPVFLAMNHILSPTLHQ